MELLQQTIEMVGDLYGTTMDEAQERLDNLLKPPGSLGKLEDIARQLAGITGNVINTINKKNIIVMAGDNGVVEEGVTSFPQEVSMLVAETMVQGISGVAVLAQHAGAELTVVDLGLSGETKSEGIKKRKVRSGTGNFAKELSMSRDEVLTAIETGIEITSQVIDDGADLLGTGEVGIGNTSTSSAVLYAITGADIDFLVGRGAGLSDEALQHKKDVIQKAVAFHKPDPTDVIDVLSKVGGLDIAGLVGCYLAAASRRVPIVIDGFISGTAAVAAYTMKPEVKNFMFTSHVSVEPGTEMIGEILGLQPMLDLNMRLGEGTGCALAFSIIEAATKIMRDMGTFSDIGM